MPPSLANATSDGSKKWKTTPGSLLQRKIPRHDAGQTQYLPAHEKEQIQDFRNWVSSSSEVINRSAPESPIIGLIEDPSAGLPSADTAGISSEPNPQPPNVFQQLLRVAPMLMELAIMELKD